MTGRVRKPTSTPARHSRQRMLVSLNRREDDHARRLRCFPSSSAPGSLEQGKTDRCEAAAPPEARMVDPFQITGYRSGSTTSLIASPAARPNARRTMRLTTARARRRGERRNLARADGVGLTLHSPSCSGSVTSRAPSAAPQTLNRRCSQYQCTSRVLTSRKTMHLAPCAEYTSLALPERFVGKHRRRWL